MSILLFLLKFDSDYYIKFIKFKTNTAGLDTHIVIASKGQMYMNVQYLSVLFLSLQNKGGSIVFKIEMIVQSLRGEKLL